MRVRRKFDYRQLPWGSVSFRRVAQAVVSRIPFIYNPVSKEEALERRKAGNFKNETKSEESRGDYAES